MSSSALTTAANSSSIVAVSELSADQVLEGLHAVAINLVQQLLKGDNTNNDSNTNLVLEIPSRAASNQVYVAEWDRIVLGSKRIRRQFTNVKECRKTALTLRVLELVQAVYVYTLVFVVVSVEEKEREWERFFRWLVKSVGHSQCGDGWSECACVSVCVCALED